MLRILIEDGVRDQKPPTYREVVMLPELVQYVGEDAIALPLISNSAPSLEQVVDSCVDQLDHRRDREGVVVFFKSHGGSHDAAERFVTTMAMEPNLRTVAVGIGAVHSVAFDIFMSFSQRLCTPASTFIAHHTRAMLLESGLIVDVTKKTIGGRSQKDWRRNSDLWFDSQIAQEQLYAQRWASLAAKFGFATPGEFLRSEIYFPAAIALQHGVVQAIVEQDPHQLLFGSGVSG
jgi:ATP-dependent protease ClpP protease subunit